MAGTGEIGDSTVTDQDSSPEQHWAGREQPSTGAAA